ncbi:hypothetical protein L195_g043038 [Trifolium pratense]|uniref:Uncharacterized protein n=2 Tax=Trifolium pratense TaxID=57577 RepID=A0A2K3M852_TRIPR|nr:uncharacterized protein LOC123922757 [Trifolium pratense]PNX86955.1 hypothetical protein L195_g043038 [Trifolium pratense]CAJ2635253.1 unnamed protein product [Trifolium pratense]
MTKNQNSRGNKLGSYMKAPLRLFGKVRDVYVRGMIQCSHDLASVDHATMVTGSYPRSFSANAATSTVSDDDFKELVRLASLRIRSGGNGVQLDAENVVKVPLQRSRSLAMERIEEGEDEEREFGDDRDDINVKPLLYTQSRSCTIPARSTMF